MGFSAGYWALGALVLLGVGVLLLSKGMWWALFFVLGGLIEVALAIRQTRRGKT
jgi:hypothetical protein